MYELLKAVDQEAEGEWTVKPNTSTKLPEKYEKYFPEEDPIFLPALESPEMPARCVSYERAEEFARQVTFDDPKGFYYSHLSGRFVFGDFVEALFVERNWHTKQLVIATLSLDENNVDSIRNLLEGGYTDSVLLIISYFHFNSKINTVGRYIKERLGEFDFEMVVVREHYKHCLFTVDNTHEPMHIGIRGTANMMSCDCYETVFVHNDQRLNDYDMTMFNRMKDIYSVTPKKPKVIKNIGGLKVWQMVVQETERPLT